PHFCLRSSGDPRHLPSSPTRRSSDLTIYPHEPKRDWAGALATLAALCARHKVDLVSVGNGTGSRETDKLVAELIAKMPQLKLTRSEEHTSELQSRENLVCRLLLEKKK